MYYNEFLKRADLRAVETFIRDGCEQTDGFCEDSASVRLRVCEKNIYDIIIKNIRNEKKYDDVMSEIFAQISTYEELAFESGLLCGARLVLQAMNRLEKML